MFCYDISPVINSDFSVFPGDVPFSLSKRFDITKGDSCTLSFMTSTLHVGSHADAPSHYHDQGDDISKRPLYYYLGNCQVIDVSSALSEGSSIQNMRPFPIEEKRILLKTNSWLTPYKWQDDFLALSGEIIDYLASKGVILVGIDNPSIDLAHSLTLEAHQRVYQHNMAILECLLLKEVPPGAYSLIALPLRIQGGDASPVRAILLPYNTVPDLKE